MTRPHRRNPDDDQPLHTIFPLMDGVPGLWVRSRHLLAKSVQRDLFHPEITELCQDYLDAREDVHTRRGESWLLLTFSIKFLFLFLPCFFVSLVRTSVGVWDTCKGLRGDWTRLRKAGGRFLAVFNLRRIAQTIYQWLF